MTSRNFFRRVHITPTDAAAEYRRELEELSSPIKAFVRQSCRVGPEHEVDIPDLYGAWRQWNEERHREVGSEQIFGRDLRAALPHLRVTQTNRAGEPRRRVYVGVGLKPRLEWGEDGEAERGGTRSEPTYATPGVALAPTADGVDSCVGSDRVPPRSGPRFSSDDRPHEWRW